MNCSPPSVDFVPSVATAAALAPAAMSASIPARSALAA
jgi:hypothetical protein